MSSKNKVSISLGSNSSDILSSWKKQVSADTEDRHVIAGRVKNGFTYCFADGGNGLELAVRLDSRGDVTRQASPDEKLSAIQALSNGEMLIDCFDRVKGKYKTLHQDDGVKLKNDVSELDK